MLKYEYDKKPKGRKTVYYEEHELIEELVKSDKESICFTYECAYEAKCANNAMRLWFIKEGIKLKLAQRGCQVYVTKEGAL